MGVIEYVQRWGEGEVLAFLTKHDACRLVGRELSEKEWEGLRLAFYGGSEVDARKDLLIIAMLHDAELPLSREAEGIEKDDLDPRQHALRRRNHALQTLADNIVYDR